MLSSSTAFFLSNRLSLFLRLRCVAHLKVYLFFGFPYLMFFTQSKGIDVLIEYFVGLAALAPQVHTKVKKT